MGDKVEGKSTEASTPKLTKPFNLTIFQKLLDYAPLNLAMRQKADPDIK